MNAAVQVIATLLLVLIAAVVISRPMASLDSDRPSRRKRFEQFILRLLGEMKTVNAALRPPRVASSPLCRPIRRRHGSSAPPAASPTKPTTLRDDGDKLAEADRHALLDDITNEAFHLERLVESLLDMTRVDSGALVLHRAAIPVDEVVGSAVARVESRLSAHRLTVTLPQQARGRASTGIGLGLAITRGLVAAHGGTIESQGLRIDIAAHTVTLDGAEVHLTPTAFRVLSLLARHAGKVLTHRQILKEVWGPGAVEHAHYLRVQMAELRKRLEVDPAQPKWLITEPGVGYRFRT